MTQRELDDVDPEECLRLLGTLHVGRLVYVDDDGPAAVPVNYSMAGRDIVLRVEGGAKRAAMAQPVVGFEVDHVDEATHAGWSVLLRGQGSEIALDDVPALIREAQGRIPAPWATGIHSVWLRIVPSIITGKRLGEARSTPPL